MNPCKDCPHNDCCDLALDYHPTKECVARTNEKILIQALEDICEHIKTVMPKTPYMSIIELLATKALQAVGRKKE